MDGGIIGIPISWMRFNKQLQLYYLFEFSNENFLIFNQIINEIAFFIGKSSKDVAH
jgi:hypothetical protein